MATADQLMRKRRHRRRQEQYGRVKEQDFTTDDVSAHARELESPPLKRIKRRHPAKPSQFIATHASVGQCAILIRLYSTEAMLREAVEALNGVVMFLCCGRCIIFLCCICVVSAMGGGNQAVGGVIFLKLIFYKEKVNKFIY